MGSLGHLSNARKEVKRLEDQILGNLGILLDNLRVSYHDHAIARSDLSRLRIIHLDLVHILIIHFRASRTDVPKMKSLIVFTNHVYPSAYRQLLIQVYWHRTYVQLSLVNYESSS